MNPSPRVLYAVAVGFTAVGVGLRLVPPVHPDAVATVEPIELAKSRTLRVAGGDPRPYAAIVGANIFSPSRAAPAVRFTPNRPNGAPAPEKAKPKPTGPVIRLFGITRGLNGAVALIDADPKIPGAEIYRVGDRVAGGPITAISDSTVVIARPSGPLTLHLSPAVKKKKP
jgi:hypothetical protein